MNKNAAFALAASRRKQGGMSLLMVLILLIVMSILGVAVLRSSAMQERMSANLRDRSLAFQGAEVALRYAQDAVLNKSGATWDKTFPKVGDACTSDGVCPGGSAAAWKSLPSGTWDATRLAAAPEYWIEFLGVGPGYKGSCDTVPVSVDCQSPMYRITARSRATGRADVTLQSTISSRIPTPGL
jgi:type IV pilus assembly protein PilX